MQSAPPRILGILGSTRRGRRGEPVADWFGRIAAGREDVAYEGVDLRDWDLPFFDEPRPPSMGDYSNDLQARWGELIAGADGFVWITAEYNHGYPPPLKNAIDFLYSEWVRKPVSIVSYGASAGGVRAAEQLRMVAIELQMAPLRNTVAIPRVFRAFDEEGVLAADAAYHERSANALLDELAWWGRALRAAREPR